jgi:hypothetical protein
MRNNSPTSTIVLSDYPVKTMTYLRYLSTLQVGSIKTLKAMPKYSTPEHKQVNLVVVDMNWAKECEEAQLNEVLEAFPHAAVLFMREDQSDMHIRFENDRDVCLLGKLAEVRVIQSTIRTLITEHQAAQHEKLLPYLETLQNPNAYLPT